ncbi:MAG: peptide ABC transporter ATP-binding protein [Spirochaetes bacterium GWD1_61_31]|nr:MAG: peptide ABC transporter ATP-binding protein [Spirochaetes bacterium GWB1_60_80]OHD28488.1 MAG: peptide ABC transporter ATP-binding protein [Spirochaetes bacterium GWC1_61_12]OHD40105.1 MAG: peptide ABC transporter ATP-binding protein [Spirochaetes bacterium GWD1_61_31]OHD45847.1 MAG: peptide ABC transporter ATP-binding protein [Spirochaetes bacterium GWE1_60_18]OHD58390.1 MAG: peptide ABC transporter ATP-binding protein [Spirochaetes bacterium GWF1_60_12]HAW85368.1 peptide ABC transpor
MNDTILEVRDLKTSFFTHLGEVQAVRGLSFVLNKGDILGIVGESGSGKSVTALSVMKLIETPGKIKAGEILFKNENLTNYSHSQMSDIRGKEIAMIFQDPMTSLNPVISIKEQMIEVIRRHQKVTRKQALERAIQMLKLVGIPEPEKRIHAYPHQFSGGMRQRAMIATALSCNPRLLIADEPTTALDVTIQAQIIDIMKDITQKLDTSIILITHDLGVIAELCTKIIVMYGGMAMEKGNIDDIFYATAHPYTRGLLKSLPRMDRKAHDRLNPIKGSPPDLMKPPAGCPFAPRCEHVMQICKEEAPALYDLGNGHESACWLRDERAPAVENYNKGGR